MAVPAAPDPNWVISDISAESAWVVGVIPTDNLPIWQQIDFIEARFSTASNFATYTAVQAERIIRDGGGGGASSSRLPEAVFLTGLAERTLYYVRTYVHNGSGYSAQGGSTKTFTTYPSAYVNKDGVWRPATPFVNVGGEWKPAECWVNVGGVWKK